VPHSPYLIFLAMDVLAYVLNNLIYVIEGLKLLGGSSLHD